MDVNQDDRSDNQVTSDQGNQDANATDSSLTTSKPITSSLLAEDPPSATNDDQMPIFECPVCIQTASFPVQLPCGHIFCFLCVKGAAHRSKRCALCRQEIPADFFNDPKLLRTDEVKEMSKTIFDEGYQWFYEGRNGWWQYDDRTSIELERRFKNGERDVFELLIAGFLYVIDLENMRQFRRSDQTRRRKIRRDLRSIQGIKGVAGLKYGDTQSARPNGDGGEASHSVVNGNINNSVSTTSNQPIMLPPQITSDNTPVLGDDAYLTPSAPNNTPQTPMTPADSQPGSLSNSQEHLNLHFQNLNVNDDPNNSSALMAGPTSSLRHDVYNTDENDDDDNEENSLHVPPCDEDGPHDEQNNIASNPNNDGHDSGNSSQSEGTYL